MPSRPCGGGLRAYLLPPNSQDRDMERPAEGLLLLHDHYTLYHHLPPVASLRRSACSDGPGPLARSSPPHATPNALNQSLAYTFRISVTVVPYICTDSRFLLDLQAEAALVRQHRRPHHLAPQSLSTRLFRLRTSYPPPPHLSRPTYSQRTHNSSRPTFDSPLTCPLA